MASKTKAAATNSNLPVVKPKRRRVQVVAVLEEFGRTWDLVRPNQLKANQVMGGEGETLNMAALNDYFMDHVHPDQREEFLAAAMADPTMEIEVLMDLMRRMSEAVFAGVETDEDDEDEVIDATARLKS